MTKNGFTFITIHPAAMLESGVWNPYNYKYSEQEDSRLFSDFAEIQKVNGKKVDVKHFDYAPIEYKHIAKGDLLTFTLEEKPESLKGNYSYVEEDTLLFGTMRAYLGNACVTPYGEWITKTRNFKFAVNSEFVTIFPFDSFKYFWWAYVKSFNFLKEMPTGSGGTRPRVSSELLSEIRVNVPSETDRQKINETLKSIAQVSWSNYIKCKNVLKNLQKEYAGIYE